MEWTWAITLAAIIGTIANIYQKRWCFMIWIVTNSVWLIIDYQAGLYAQAFLFGVYILLAIWGLLHWSKDKTARGDEESELCTAHSGS